MPVFIGSIPNTEQDDVELAKDILSGAVNLKGFLETLQNKFNDKIYLFNKGRESLYFLLNILGITNEDEVLTQAFTCVAVVAPILWTEATPVYVEIDPRTFNINPNLIKEKISEKTRAIIIQHTFGNIVNIEPIRKLVDELNKNRDIKRKIYIIEDCAHVFFSNYKKSGLGKYSDAFFFSFSQDKSISCTQGAMLVINDLNITKIADEKYKNLEYPSKKDSLYNARYIKAWDMIKKMYYKKIIPSSNITIGKALIIIYRLLGITKKQASIETLSSVEPQKMSEEQACLLLNQLEKNGRFNNHRKEITKIYNELINKCFKFNSNDILLRYPILVSNKAELKEKLKSIKVIAGIWYHTPIFPLKKELERVGYTLGNCPNAEICGENILNLPLNIEVNKEKAMQIIEIVNTFAKPVKI